MLESPGQVGQQGRDVGQENVEQDCSKTLTAGVKRHIIVTNIDLVRKGD